MNKFNLFIVIFVVLFLFGCDSYYNLTIDDDKFIEEINIQIDNSYLNRDFYPFHNNTNVLYNKELIQNDNNNYVKLSYSYSPNEFLSSTAYSDCFSDRLFENNEDYYHIKMYKLMECYYGEDYVINIKTDNKVIYNNADSVKNNVYSWYVNDDNKDNLLIEIKISKKLKNKNSNFIAYIICGVIVITLLYFVIKYKRDSNNKDDI